jgi:hypothetical protein
MPMSKQRPLLLMYPVSSQRQYRSIWSRASNRPRSTRLAARHSAIDVSSVHCPASRWKRSAAGHVGHGSEGAARPELHRRADGVACREAEQRAAKSVESIHRVAPRPLYSAYGAASRT